MSAKDSVIEAALKLSEEERLEVAERMYESMGRDADYDQGWDAEIQRRIKSIEDGTAKLVPWEEARRRIVGEDEGGDAR